MKAFSSIHSLQNIELPKFDVFRTHEILLALKSVSLSPGLVPYLETYKEHVTSDES